MLQIEAATHSHKMVGLGSDLCANWSIAQILTQYSASLNLDSLIVDSPERITFSSASIASNVHCEHAPQEGAIQTRIEPKQAFFGAAWTPDTVALVRLPQSSL